MVLLIALANAADVCSDGVEPVRVVYVTDGQTGVFNWVRETSVFTRHDTGVVVPLDDPALAHALASVHVHTALGAASIPLGTQMALNGGRLCPGTWVETWHEIRLGLQRGTGQLDIDGAALLQIGAHDLWQVYGIVSYIVTHGGWPLQAAIGLERDVVTNMKSVVTVRAPNTGMPSYRVQVSSVDGPLDVPGAPHSASLSIQRQRTIDLSGGDTVGVTYGADRRIRVTQDVETAVERSVLRDRVASAWASLPQDVRDAMRIAGRPSNAPCPDRMVGDPREIALFCTINADWRSPSTGWPMVWVPPPLLLPPSDKPNILFGAIEVTAGMAQELLEGWSSPLGPNDAIDRPVSGPWALPAVGLGLDNTIQLANSLSEMDGLRPAYVREGSGWAAARGADGYRLPTFEEWLFAAGVDAEADGPAWSGCSHANLDIAGCGRPRGVRGVASLDATPWGIYDLFGNAAERLWGTTDRPGRTRIVGGSWLTSDAGRHWWASQEPAQDASPTNGVRFVRDAR